MDKDKIDLNAPAFGPGAQRLGDTEPTEEIVVEPVAEVKKEEVIEEPSEEDSKVPYSRFKKFHDKALEAEKEAAYWRGVAESKPEIKEEVGLPASWVKLYGDSPESKEVWLEQRKLNEQTKEDIRKEALEAVRNEYRAEKERAEENVGAIQGHLEQVAEAAGRDLTEKESDALLTIIDEYTPKDEDGNYAGNLISADKAWEIYELKQQAGKASKVQSRNQVASLTGSQTQGSPEQIAEQNKNWNPLDWDGYKKRI